MKNPKPIIWWTIEKPYGGRQWALSPYYSSNTRKGAIGMITCNVGRDWAALKEDGFMAVKITVKKFKK